MSETLNMAVLKSSQQTKHKLTLRDWVLALLAQVMPQECFHQSNNSEATYLAPYRDLLTGLPIEQWLASITSTIDHPDPAEQDLIKLAVSQDLSLLEILVIFLCYEVESDPMVGRCIAYLQKPVGGSRPTLSLLSSMLIPLNPVENKTARQRTLIAKIVNSKAVQLGLLQILNESVPLPERGAQIPTALALAITAGEVIWPGAVLGLNGQKFELPPSILDLARSQAEALNATPNSVLVLRCASNQEASITADAVATFSNRSALFINDETKALPALGPICHEKHLTPVFSYTCGPGEMISLPEIKGYQGSMIVMAGLEGSFETITGAVTNWTIPKPTLNERKRLWQKYLGNNGLAYQLASDHVHSTSRIVELANLAKQQRIVDQKEKITIEEIRKAAWLSESSGLSSLAQPVTANVTNKALIVRPLTKQQLELLENRCRIRERLSDKLGITLKVHYQMGVKALFIGPSGTGKTLATGWLANKLGIPLYRVDLAAITSKFIGETEKNLATLLSRAEQEEVVLLFDEADSVFGKRTEIRDSNDRFANAQTNYLLQRIETYSGVVILTSNSKARFDSAFTRRLDMMIEFPLPNPEERRAIWLSHLGSYHQLTKAKLNQLAVQCDLAGGHIRNVVLSAAVVAKQANQPITMQDIVIALSGEYRKLGKQMPPELKRVIQPN